MPAAFDRLPLGALRVFEAVASRLSFSAAADSLNVTPAAVSQQIKALEEYIQVPLFRRNGRSVELTEEGLELLPAVRSGLEPHESAMQQIKQHRRAGPLQITTLASFLQAWLVPRIRSFRRKHPTIELRFHTSLEVVDFARSNNHVAIRFGRGDYPNLHSEKVLDDWLVPVASPDLIKQYGMIERGANPNKFPLLESGDKPWSVWTQIDEEAAWLAKAPSIDDSAGLLTAAEEGLGYVLTRWTLVSRALQKGSLRLAGKGALPYGSAYYFVCPKNFLGMPKVALFRDWIIGAARDFPSPGSKVQR